MISWLPEVITALTVCALSLAIPYTKVEESFNFQAIHDFTIYGFDLAEFDHVQFPGPLPRTFIGALLVSLPLKVVKSINPEVSSYTLGQLARIVIGLANSAAIVGFSNAVVAIEPAKRRKLTKLLLYGMLLGQFHLMYYASRPLPNMLAFPLFLYSLQQYLQNYMAGGLAVATFACATFRSELSLFFGVLIIISLLLKRVSFKVAVGSSLLGLLAGVAVSLTLDSYCWQRWTWPELHGIIYNVFENKSANWGTEPYWYYFSRHLPNIMGTNVLFGLCLLGVPFSSKPLRTLGCTSLAYVAIYSLLPHKELRFVLYTGPVFAAIGASAFSRWFKPGSTLWRVWGRRLIVALIGFSVATTCLKSFISSQNYPGGHALSIVNELVDRRFETSQQESLVHLDVLTCMTGASRFAQSSLHAKYDKTEDDQPELPSVLESCDFLVVSSTTDVDKTKWDQIRAVQSFAGISVQPIKQAVKLALNPKAVKNELSNLRRFVLGPISTVALQAVNQKDAIIIYGKRVTEL